MSLTRTTACLAGLILALHLSVPLAAQTLPPGFVEEAVMSGWARPMGVTWDANERMYVWEKRGMVWIVENGVRLPAPLLDISQEVGNWDDHGCLGFALHPDFENNGWFYLLYLVDRHHLMNFGTPGYNPNTNEYSAATIMRLTRYTAQAPSFNTVVPGSRTVLLGETPQTGVPNLHRSHSAGSVVFGTDGTLLLTVGDGASYNSADRGNAPESYFIQALADGIIRPEENVGAFRAQMVNSLNGKILRLDPVTGNGVPSNPYYDPAEPRSPRSRVWGLGVRNAFRAALRPGSGATDPAMGRPGSLYMGDVGYVTWEELNVCHSPGMNFGWPMFEGHTANNVYMNNMVDNLDAPVPGYDGFNCDRPYYRFQDLLKQATASPFGVHPDPCSDNKQIPAHIPSFIHARPAIDYWHNIDWARAPIYVNGEAAEVSLSDPSSPVPGPDFNGFAAIGGTWLSGAGWPEGYQDVYFMADYAGGWAKRFHFDAQDRPVAVDDFASGLGLVIFMAEGPDGHLYYVRHNTEEVRRIRYTLPVNLPPTAVATQNVQYGPSPLVVQFSSNGSSDPEGGALQYLWDFDNGFTSTQANPSRIFTAPLGVPTTYNVTLTVTDPSGLSDVAELIVSVNNTPPQVAITSFADGATYPVGTDTLFALAANVSDAEHGPAQLSYVWRTTLDHASYTPPPQVTTTPTGNVDIGGLGCDDLAAGYAVELTVTDAGGLSTTVVHELLPRCSAVGPTAVIATNVDHGAGPLLVVFDGSGSYGPAGVVSHQWDFGDGGSSTAVEPSHVFTDQGDHFVTLRVSDANGRTHEAMRVVTVLDTDPPDCVGSLGSVTREVWNNVTGITVNNLLNAPGYPDQPSSVDHPTSFQGPSNVANNYGTRVRGYIIPSQTGDHVFTATGDDAVLVYLSPNADPRYKREICNVPGLTGQTEYDKFATQVSEAIPLVAGRYYYVELLHKEGTSADHFALRWQTPGNSTRVVIPGANLARWQDCTPSIYVRAILQGGYDVPSALMRADLRDNALLPGTEPYTALGFQHAGGGGGETLTAPLLALEGGNKLVDWVLVELRNGNDPAQLVATRSALLQRDGDVIGTDGRTRLRFNVPPGNYHVSLRHRNHLGAMRLGTLPLGRQQRLLDLVRSDTPTFGTGARASLPDGKRGLWSGNVVPDAILKYTGAANDRDAILSGLGGTVPTATTPGYLSIDVNLDGLGKYTGAANDRDAILQNVGGSVPTAVRVEQLP